jgi:hypothetical protein
MPQSFGPWRKERRGGRMSVYRHLTGFSTSVLIGV